MLNFKKFTLICIVLAAGSALSYIFFGSSPGWFVLIVLIWLMGIIAGSFSMSWNFFLSAFTHNPNPASKVVAITFDDGPHPEYTPMVLKLLADFNATATFFCIGNRVEQFPEVLKLIVANGHEIGNHSYSHSPFISFKSHTLWEGEINRTDEVIEQHMGTRPTLFRPPYGVTTPHLSKVIKKSSHRVIGWSVRSFDTVLRNPNFLLKRITKKIKPGDIILLHDTHKNIPSVLEHLLLFLNEQDYKTVSITQLRNDKTA